MLPATAEQIELNGSPHEVDELISMSIGPGITYKRLRSETYPLNINMLIMDVSNPYNRLETTTANESAQGTEMLVKAAARQTTPEKRVLAGANANFWCVSSQDPYSPTLVGACYGGHARNGEMITETNMHADQWNHGWTHTGIIGIDVDKMMHVGHLYFRGYVKNDKIGSPEIYQVNKVVRSGEIGMYNSFYGKNKTFRPIDQYTASNGKPAWEIVNGDCTEVLLDFADGGSWKISDPMTFVVKEVRMNAGTGTLGDNDVALVGRGDKQALLANLAVGDIVTLETNYYENDQPVKLENFVAGNATVMLNGELTPFNASETYNSQVYSRTGYGMSADGKTLYVVVIDKSTDKTYGKSAGCPTRVMCELARHYGCSNMVNCDAGGSAEMFYNGAVINTTTEGTPRAVSNGMFLYSIAPADDQVARMEFYDISLLAPSYSSFSPRIIAYNKYGDVIDYDFRGYTLSCPEELGTCEGNVFIAGATSMTGTLTASFGDVVVSKDITVKNSEISFRIKPIVIDHIREYRMEVTAKVGDNVYDYDPSRLEWTVDDETVASISADGILTGLKNGVTAVRVNIGEYTDETTVRVEIPAAEFMTVTDNSGWTFKQSGVKNAKMDENGNVDFTVAVGRTVSLELVKRLDLYGLPESVNLTFECDIPVDKVQADVRTPLMTRTNYLDATNGDKGFEGGKEYKVEWPLSDVADLSDLANFPLKFNSLKFNFPKDSGLNGAHSLKIKSLETRYAHFSGIGNVAVDGLAASVSVSPNPVVGGVVNVMAGADINSVSIYSTAGLLVRSTAAEGRTVSMDVAGLSSGIYILVADTDAGRAATRVIIK